MNGTSTEARNAAKHPSVPQERPTAGFLQTPESAVLKARCLAWRGGGDGGADPNRLGLRQHNVDLGISS